MTVFLIRHCQSSGQAPTASLTTLGQQQARDLSPILVRLSIGSVYSSPYKRAKDTIQPFAKKTGLGIHFLDAFAERVLAPTDQPDWLDHIRKSFDDPAYALPGGESLNNCAARMRSGLEIACAQSKGNLAVVSHGNAIAALLMQLTSGFGFEDWRGMQNPDIFRLSFHENKPQAFCRIEL